MKLVTAFAPCGCFRRDLCHGRARERRRDEFTPAQKQELGAFIKDYLVNNPEVLRDAI